MAFGIQSSGDFIPYVKYNTKAGRWYVKKDDAEVEVMSPVFVVDFKNVKTGWFLFASGMAPDKVINDNLTQWKDRPSEKHKQGIAIRFFSNAHFGGLVELTTTSRHFLDALGAIHNAYLVAPEAEQDMLPVVKFTGVTTINDPKGTNYAPNFVIEKWVPRPAEFDAQATPATAAPVAYQAPVAAPAPAPVVNSVSEF